MAGISLRIKGQPFMRVVTVPIPSDKGKELFYLTQGTRIIRHKVTTEKGKFYATFWVDTSGELPCDGMDVAFPSGWDYRAMLKA